MLHEFPNILNISKLPLPWHFSDCMMVAMETHGVEGSSLQSPSRNHRTFLKGKYVILYISRWTFRGHSRFLQWEKCHKLCSPTFPQRSLFPGFMIFRHVSEVIWQEFWTHPVQQIGQTEGLCRWKFLSMSTFVISWSTKLYTFPLSWLLTQSVPL